jgi:hypothetical protein
MFSLAFDKPVYGEGKYYLLRGRLYISMYDNKYYINAPSPVADDAFPSRLTSLSKQRESIIRHRAS